MGQPKALLAGVGTLNSLHSLLPGSCHGDHQTLSINPWRKEASLRGGNGAGYEPPLRGGLKAVKETSELRCAQQTLSPLSLLFCSLSPSRHFSGGPEANPSLLSQSWQTPRGSNSL